MKHAITSLISVISSTLKGVEYLTTRNNMVNIHNFRLLLKKLYKSWNLKKMEVLSKDFVWLFFKKPQLKM